MKVGIDLGTTNSALAYIDEREAEDREFPPVRIFETPQLVAAGRTEPRRTLPSFLFLEDGQPVGVYAREQGALVPTRLVHSAKSWLSNPDVDRTAKILPWDSPETGRVLSPVDVSARLIAKFREEWDRAQGRAAGGTGYRAHGAGLVRRRGARVDGDGGARCRARPADAARRTGGGVLFVDRQQPGAIAQETVRRPDRAGLRRGRRHQRFQPDSHFARRRPGEFHAHGGRQAPAAGRRQPGSDAGVAGGDQAGRAAFHPPAQRAAAAMLGGQGAAAERSGFAERRDHGAGLRFGAHRQIAQDRDSARGSAGTGARRFPAVHASAAKGRRRKSAACSANSACHTFPTPPSRAT